MNEVKKKKCSGFERCLNVLTRHFTICLTASGFHRAERRRGDPVRVKITAGNMHRKERVASSAATACSEIPKLSTILSKGKKGGYDRLRI